MNTVLIRKAKNSDLNDIIDLLKQLGYPQDLHKFKKYFEIFCKQKDYGVAIAKQQNKVVGLVAWSTNMMLVIPKKRLHIEGLVVDNQYRRQGIAKKLMAYVEKFAKQCNACVIEVTSGIRRTEDGTHQFYEAIGYSNKGPMSKLFLRKKV